MNTVKIASIVVACCLTLAARAVDFTFALDKAAVTSAGVYDGQGRLVRVLWTMRELPAGTHSATWDETDAFNHRVKVAGHRLKVVANRSTYANVGAIGNSGRTPDDKGHTPTNIEGVAVDSDGSVYSANGWDEAGADFKKWDADGNAVYDAGFQIRNGRPNGAPYAIAVDEEYIYCAVGGWDREPWRNRQQIQRFRRSDGKHVPFSEKSVKSSADEPKSGGRPSRVGKGPSDQLLAGHIQVYEWPELLIPKDATEPERRLMREPLRSIDVAGSTLYVADALGGVVRMYDSETGAPKGDFAAHLPRAIAVDPIGQVWVGDNEGTIRAYRTDGYSGVTYGGLGEITGMAFGAGAKLYVADAKAGQVVTLNNSPDQPENFTPVLGQKANAGDRAADRFYKLRGVAVDRAGNLITIQREPGASGARVARWSPKGKLLWEHFGTEFVSIGNYGVGDPTTLYTITHHRHRLIDRAKGTWEYLGNAVDLGGFPTSDNTYRSDPHGVLRVLKIGQRDFIFMPTGDGVQVYRVDGPVLRLASIVGGNDPSPDGEKGKGNVTKWAWSDERGTGKPDPKQIRATDDHYTCFGMDVDARGNVWFANTHTHSVWTIPLAGLDARGNPRYDWGRAREVAPRDESEFGFDPNMAQAAADGSFYAFGWSKAYPQPKDNPFWMGGTTLCRFDAKGRRLWAVELPQACVGMDVIPGGKGGVLVGGGKGATIYHYTADGLLVGKVSPGEAMAKQSGWLDNHASVAVNRDPRDGLLDVFVEDDYTCRIGWYRVDDRGIEAINGEVRRP